jgi:hypothetical protein
LINAIPGIVNVMVISLLFFMLFGIFGTNYFKGVFFLCIAVEGSMVEDILDTINDRWECLDNGGDWINKDASFDNVIESMITLFEMATTEGWIDVMLVIMSNLIGGVE